MPDNKSKKIKIVNKKFGEAGIRQEPGTILPDGRL